jgi:membrane protein insertase Oxa1/YidC/SpoIIIJ
MMSRRILMVSSNACRSAFRTPKSTHSRLFHSSPAVLSDKIGNCDQGSVLGQVDGPLDLSHVIASSSESTWTGPVDLTVMGLDYIHIMTGLPWWATIACSTFALRTALFPLAVKAIKNSHIAKRIKPELDMINNVRYVSSVSFYCVNLSVEIQGN